MVRLGKVLKFHRKKKGFTQEVFSTKAKISRFYLSRLENDRQDISLRLLRKLCKLLNVPEEIVFWEATISALPLTPQEYKRLKITEDTVRKRFALNFS